MLDLKTLRPNDFKSSWALSYADTFYAAEHAYEAKEKCTVVYSNMLDLEKGMVRRLDKAGDLYLERVDTFTATLRQGLKDISNTAQKANANILLLTALEQKLMIGPECTLRRLDSMLLGENGLTHGVASKLIGRGGVADVLQSRITDTSLALKSRTQSIADELEIKLNSNSGTAARFNAHLNGKDGIASKLAAKLNADANGVVATFTAGIEEATTNANAAMIAMSRRAKELDVYLVGIRNNSTILALGAFVCLSAGALLAAMLMTFVVR